MNIARQYTSNRAAIVNALSEVLKTIDGSGEFLTNVFTNVKPKVEFWDEIQEFPALRLGIGSERREYQGGGYKDRFLSVTVRCYVKDDDSSSALERLLKDVETVIEENGRLAYQDASGVLNFTQDILILSIDTDEGVLSPLGVGEILLQVRY